MSDDARNGVRADIDALRKDINSLKDDIGALFGHSGAQVQEEVRKATRKAGVWARGATEHVADYKEISEDRIREHPLVAVGAAVVAGFLIAALTNRR
jgi:ElaB/YqjD/DUF883 family membrane-anchored ribosome-binding protein